MNDEEEAIIHFFPRNINHSKRHYTAMLKELKSGQAVGIVHKDVAAYLRRCYELTGVRVAHKKYKGTIGGVKAAQDVRELCIVKTTK